MHETSDFLFYNNLLIYQVLSTLIFRRRSLDFFLYDKIAMLVENRIRIHQNV